MTSILAENPAEQVLKSQEAHMSSRIFATASLKNHAGATLTDHLPFHVVQTVRLLLYS